MADRLLAIFIIVLGLTYIYGATFIRVVSGGQADPLGPRVFPFLIGSIAVLAGIVLIFETMQKQDSPEDKQTAGTIPSQPLAVTAMFVWILLYYLAFEPVGYLISTSVFMFGLMIFFNRGKWITNALVSILFPLTIYTAFTQLLQKDLGEGLLFF